MLAKFGKARRQPLGITNSMKKILKELFSTPKFTRFDSLWIITMSMLIADDFLLASFIVMAIGAILSGFLTASLEP